MGHPQSCLYLLRPNYCSHILVLLLQGISPYLQESQVQSRAEPKASGGLPRDIHPPGPAGAWLSGLRPRGKKAGVGKGDLSEKLRQDIEGAEGGQCLVEQTGYGLRPVFLGR